MFKIIFIYLFFFFFAFQSYRSSARKITAKLIARFERSREGKIFFFKSSENIFSLTPCMVHYDSTIARFDVARKKIFLLLFFFFYLSFIVHLHILRIDSNRARVVNVCWNNNTNETKKKTKNEEKEKNKQVGSHLLIVRRICALSVIFVVHLWWRVEGEWVGW